MARLDAKWDNFSDRGQTWNHFWQDTEEVASSIGNIVESSSVSDSYISNLTTIASLSEITSVVDSSTRWLIASALASEASPVVDVESANALLLASITEPISGSDVQSAVKTLVGVITDGASAIDVSSALQHMVAAIVESGNIVDATISTKQLFAGLSETISVTDLTTGGKNTISGIIEVLIAIETSNFVISGGNTFPSNRLINDMRLINQWNSATIMVFMSDATNHIDGKTGLTLSIMASKDGSMFSAVYPQVTEIGYGWYKIKLLRQHTDVLGDLVLHVIGTGADPSYVLCSVGVKK